MIQNFYKTDHFLYRQWDRAVEDRVIDSITCKLKPTKAKTTIIASSKFLKSLKLQFSKTTYLIIVAKDKSLLTLFFVDDLYLYLKSLKGKINPIIF